MRIDFLTARSQLPRGWTLEVSLRQHANKRMAGLLWIANRRRATKHPIQRVFAYTVPQLLTRIKEVR